MSWLQEGWDWGGGSLHGEERDARGWCVLWPLVGRSMEGFCLGCGSILGIHEN